VTATHPSEPGPGHRRNDADSPRIGIIGADAPRQLILACGAIPVRLHGAWSGEVTQEAAELLGAADAVALRLLGDVLSGRHDGLAAVVVCNDSMADLRIFYVLRILADRGRLRFPVHLLDTPRGGGAHRGRFVARQYARLAEFVSTTTGRHADAASLAGAAAAEAALAQALAQVQGRRRTRTLSGTAALEAYRLAAQTEPAQALERITDLLDASDMPPSSSETGAAVPVYVTGSSHPDATVYAVLEAAGVMVVGEDHDAGDAAWTGETVDAASLEDTCRALAQRHALRPPSASRSLSAERTRHLLAELERTGTTRVIALVRELDDGPVWDLAEQRRALADTGTWLAEAVRVPPDGAAEAAAALATRLQPARRAPQ
jgi:benzoyl-CoA reductase/2-hydroxyglutaryl-CoA dehydratase subunit BcrC/BadD/HgdB